MIKFLVTIFLFLIIISSCSNENLVKTLESKKIESATIYPNSDAYTIEQAKGMRQISEMQCKSGNDSYCVDLARMLFSGFGEKKDSVRAMLTLKISCDRGYSIACAQIIK